MKRSVFLLLLLFILLSVTTGCEFDSPEYRSFSNVKIESIKPESAEILLDLTIHNPNNYKINIRKSTFDVYINDNFMGKAHLKEKFKMKKLETTTQTVPIHLDLEKGNLINLVLMSQSRSTVELRLKGPLKATVAGMPVRKKIDKKKDFNLRDLNLDLKGFGF